MDNELRARIERSMIDGIEVMSKVMTIDPATFQPRVKCVIEFDYTLEIMQDGKSLMTAEEVYIIIGKAISDKAAKVPMVRTDWRITID